MITSILSSLLSTDNLYLIAFWRLLWIRERNRVYAKASYERHKEARKASQRTYSVANHEKILARGKVYRTANPEQYLAKNKALHLANRERRLAHSKAYHLANREHIHARKKAWATNNKEKIKASREANKDKKKAYRTAHRKETAARMKAYRDAHPDKVRNNNARRRARLTGAAINDFTAQQWRDMQAAYDHRCVYCHKRCKGKLTQDHITPLSKGGTHTLTNIVPSCRSCNSKKHTGPVLKPVQPLLL